MTPGRLRGSVSPPPRPSAGTCPPRPGQVRGSPRRPRAREGQHRQRPPRRRRRPTRAGAAAPARPAAAATATPARKPNASADSGRASTAAATSSRTYPRLRSTAWTSGAVAVPAPRRTWARPRAACAASRGRRAAPSYDVCSSPRIRMPRHLAPVPHGRCRVAPARLAALCAATARRGSSPLASEGARPEAGVRRRTRWGGARPARTAGARRAGRSAGGSRSGPTSPAGTGRTGGGFSSSGVDSSHSRSMPSAVVNSVWSPRIASWISRS